MADVGGEIDDELAVNDKVIVGLLEVQGEHLCRYKSEAQLLIGIGETCTMTAELQVQYIADTDVHNAEETLIALLELTLVEYLHSDNGGILDSARGPSEKHIQTRICDAHVEALVPVRVQRLLNHTGRVGLLRIYRDDREGVWQSKDLTLGQAIGSNNCGLCQGSRSHKPG